jgi:hypothetical protein
VAAAVVVAAVVDGARDEEPTPVATTQGDRDADASAALRMLGARGELLLYGEHCGEERLVLPALTHRRNNVCRPRGVDSPDGEIVARCVEGNVETRLLGTGELQLLPGCAPAWRPDGTLTAAYGDEIVSYRLCGQQRCAASKLIGRTQLERAARRHPSVPERPARLRALVDEVAWLSNTRAAVSISIRLGGRFEGLGPLGAIAFFDRGRVEQTPQYFRLTGGRLAASPRGSYVTQTPDLILRPDGSQLTLPQYLRDVHDFAWSPDERFVALATPFAIEVVDVGSLERYDRTGGGLRSVTLPQATAHLVWR